MLLSGPQQNRSANSILLDLLKPLLLPLERKASNKGAMIENAISLLKETSYFQDADEDLLHELAERMVPVSVEDGHIFLEEGEEIHSILVLEEGVIHRTKLSVENTEKEDLRSSLRDLPEHRRNASMAVHSILVDKIIGRGKVTGLLHNFREGSDSFATVAAAGPVKAWLIDGEDFREVVSSSPEFALEMMASLSKELRAGNMSLRALLHVQSSSNVGQGSNEKRVCKVMCYDTTSWVSEGFRKAVESFNSSDQQDYTIQMDYTSELLTEKSAAYAAGYNVVCLFVNDTANAAVLRTLSLLGVGKFRSAVVQQARLCPCSFVTDSPFVLAHFSLLQA